MQLDSGERLVIDHIILATGYKVNIGQIPFLAKGNIAATLATHNGFPVLDEHFQTNLPSLFITSMAANQDLALSSRYRLDAYVGHPYWRCYWFRHQR